MQASPLSLRDYFTTDLSFSAIPNFDPEKSKTLVIWPNDLSVEIGEWRSESNPLKRRCKITVELKDSEKKGFPYVFSITLIGFFEIADWWPPEQVDHLFSANAPALLYSAAREAITTVTGRGPYNRIVLPSITFVKFSDDIKKQDNAPLLLEKNEEEKNTIEKDNIEKVVDKKSPRKKNKAIE